MDQQIALLQFSLIIVFANFSENRDPISVINKLFLRCCRSYWWAKRIKSNFNPVPKCTHLIFFGERGVGGGGGVARGRGGGGGFLETLKS